MEINFSFEELEIQKSVRKFARNDLIPAAGELNAKGSLPPGMQEKFLSMGLLRSPFPEEYGGIGGTFTGLILAIKELSYASVVPAWILFENFMLAYPVFKYGSDALKAGVLPRLISMESTGALAFTEPNTGSDPAQLTTTAKKVDGGWILNGTKRFITHSGICDRMILFARTGDDVTAFLVESTRKGYTAGKRESFMQSYAFDNGDVLLEDYIAPDEHVIGKAGQGFEILLNTETLGKIAFCSLFAGLAERAADLAVQYAGTRLHRGKPIGQRFQMTQFKLAEISSKLEALNAYLFSVCAKADSGKDVFMDAAGLKLLVAREVQGITSYAMEIHGAYGLSREYEISDIYRAAISAKVVMGSLDIQRVILAKGLLGRGRARP